MGSERRAVDAAAKTVLRAYKDFCFEYYQVSSGAKSWQEESTFSLTCFDSRVDVGCFVISAYQGICNDTSIPITSGFASAIRQESWCNIAQTLLVGGLGLAAEKVDKQSAKRIGNELRMLLNAKSGHLQAFLLSLLQMMDDLTSKVSPQAMYCSKVGQRFYLILLILGS